MKTVVKKEEFLSEKIHDSKNEEFLSKELIKKEDLD